MYLMALIVRMINLSTSKACKTIKMHVLIGDLLYMLSGSECFSICLLIFSFHVFQEFQEMFDVIMDYVYIGMLSEQLNS